jgi:threonine synthase
MADVDRTIWAADRYMDVSLDPHTAVAMHAALEDRVWRGNAGKDIGTYVVLETALPDKFPDTMALALRYRYPLSQAVEDLLTQEQRCTTMPNDLSLLKAYVAELAEKARHT